LRQLGQSVAVQLKSDAHLIAEFTDAEAISAEAEITAARESDVPSQFLLSSERTY
jgi:hypothetical protein